MNISLTGTLLLFLGYGRYYPTLKAYQIFFLKFHMSEITQFWSFCVWLILVKMKISNPPMLLQMLELYPFEGLE